jgi:glucan phosphoethanolaminetransferase (alkaline phosphatase superfamily)
VVATDQQRRKRYEEECERLNRDNGSRRVSRNAMAILAITVLLLGLALLVVFARASIEVGEERFWLFVWLFVVPPVAAAAFIWIFNVFSWPVRGLIGLTVLIAVAVALVQAALFADKVYETPNAFRPLLPVILRVERAYLALFPTEPYRQKRHQEKEQRWQELLRSP